MILNTEDRKLLVSHPLDRLIVQVNLGDFDVIVIQALWVHGKSVVLSRD